MFDKITGFGVVRRRSLDVMLGAGQLPLRIGELPLQISMPIFRDLSLSRPIFSSAKVSCTLLSASAPAAADSDRV